MRKLRAVIRARGRGGVETGGERQKVQRRERKHQYNTVSTEVTIAQVLPLGAVE